MNLVNSVFFSAIQIVFTNSERPFGPIRQPMILYESPKTELASKVASLVATSANKSFLRVCQFSI